MQMRAIEKEMADEAYRISHILWDFPLRLEANIQMWPNNLCKRRRLFLFFPPLSFSLSLFFLTQRRTNKRCVIPAAVCVFIKGVTSGRVWVSKLRCNRACSALSLQILSENVSDPPTLIPLLLLPLLLLFFFFLSLSLSPFSRPSLHQKVGGLKRKRKPLFFFFFLQHCQCILLFPAASSTKCSPRKKKKTHAEKHTWKPALWERRGGEGGSLRLHIPPSCPDHLQLVGTGVKRKKKKDTDRGKAQTGAVLTRLGVFLLSFSRFTSGNVPRRLHTFRSSFFHRGSSDSVSNSA